MKHDWYLPFQEYRARLVLMMDKLLNIFKTDPTYRNFMLDGQVIPLEDYLEVCPEKEEEIITHVKENRLSIGPMYVLPDEFLVSGESLIRNLLIGHQLSQKFGKVMKAGYIPDPFGHIAQLPQILSGFELPAILFWRGFGNEFEDNELNVEFWWNAPGNAASILGVLLIYSYGSVAEMSLKKIDGKYKAAISKMKRVISHFEKFTATPFVLLNSGSDHHEAKPEIPEIVRQWNKKYPEKLMEQNDVEYYISKILESNPRLNSFQGELRGGKYAHLLSGVFSARMWIKQRNTSIEYLYEKYTEPLATITWALDNYNKFRYPQGYIFTGLKWMIKNHPHDSICGCSIDQVHDEMKTRFDWAEQIGEEVFKNSMLYLTDLIDFDTTGNKTPFIVYNPLPWKRKDILHFNIFSHVKKATKKSPGDFTIVDSNGENIPYQVKHVNEEPRYQMVFSITHLCSSLVEVPACGYKVFYLIPDQKPEDFDLKDSNLKLSEKSIENEFYKVEITQKGIIQVLDKESNELFENICYFEDVGDWGDEYDFAGPRENQTDLQFSSEDLNILSIEPYIDGTSQKTIKIEANLNLPSSLTEDRYNRDDYLVSNLISIYITLYKGIKRVDFKVLLENNSKDHRIRVLFPTKIKTEKVDCDGHFYVLPRNVDLPIAERWAQKPLPTNHQKDFVSVSNHERNFAVINKGLPEYEAIKNVDETITLAITLLRCIEWLSRHDLSTRGNNAGPDLNTPGAQCIGKHEFEFSIIIHEGVSSWIDAKIHQSGKEVNNPLKVVFPSIVRSSIRAADKAVVKPFGILSYFDKPHINTLDSCLPPELSFIEIDNSNIILSALKKSEAGNDLIVRVYNISSHAEKGSMSFYNGITITGAKIVNFLEEPPQREIKAFVDSCGSNTIKFSIEPHVIATFRMEIGK
ncbi:MAG: alpha-mannosidase [Promethearchaeota archaeon]